MQTDGFRAVSGSQVLPAASCPGLSLGCFFWALGRLALDGSGPGRASAAPAASRRARFSSSASWASISTIFHSALPRAIRSSRSACSRSL
ncbi:hypothetical protein VTK73DRAFT_4239 [Phialemonium thermophilum]|uniref:Secreted protein n=1 Tax=Phialemonium thermophilum TaxID=223376 RepID=A0ABR3VAB3_9PEZI